MRGTILIAALFFTAAAAAQPTWTLPPGSRVRLTVQDSQMIGSVISAEPDSLRIRFPGHDSTWTLAWSAISTMDIARPTPRSDNARKGAIVGGVVGAVAGGVIGASHRKPNDWFDPAIMGAGVGLLAGAALGGAVGAAGESERWERVLPVVTYPAAGPPRRRSNFATTPTLVRP